VFNEWPQRKITSQCEDEAAEHENTRPVARLHGYRLGRQGLRKFTQTAAIDGISQGFDGDKEKNGHNNSKRDSRKLRPLGLIKSHWKHEGNQNHAQQYHAKTQAGVYNFHEVHFLTTEVLLLSIAVSIAENRSGSMMLIILT
jgi:hypothetical protein